MRHKWYIPQISYSVIHCQYPGQIIKDNCWVTGGGVVLPFITSFRLNVCRFTLSFEAAKRVGRLGKPEAYYYPPQYNNVKGKFPHTYFGFTPGVTKEEVKERLEKYVAGDGRITELSRAYRIQLGTGWYTPPGDAWIWGPTVFCLTSVSIISQWDICPM